MRLFDFEAALDMRMHVSLEDVTAEEFWGLKVLRSERDRKRKEDQEAEERKAQQRQRKMHAHSILQGQNNPR